MVRNLTLVALCVAVLIAPRAMAGAADRGSAFVSGQLGLNYCLKNGAVPATLQVNLAPRALYFLTKGLGVGLDGNLGSSSTDDFSSTTLAVGPRVAYYLKMNRSRYPHACCMTPWFGMGTYWMPFAGLSLMYLNETVKVGSNKDAENGYRGRVGVGAAPMIGDRGTMFFELGFQTQSLSSSPEDANRVTNQIYLEAGFGAFLFSEK
jgi:hypothetical protein